MEHETRSKQQRVLMTPSTKRKVDELSRVYGVSLGDLVEWAVGTKLHFERQKAQARKEAQE